MGYKEREMRNDVESKSIQEYLEDFKKFDNFYWKTHDFFYKYIVLSFRKHKETLLLK